MEVLSLLLVFKLNFCLTLFSSFIFCNSLHLRQGQSQELLCLCFCCANGGWYDWNYFRCVYSVVLTRRVNDLKDKKRRGEKRLIEAIIKFWYLAGECFLKFEQQWMTAFWAMIWCTVDWMLLWHSFLSKTIVFILKIN